MREEPGTADALERLAGALESLDLGDESPFRSERDRLAGIVRSYLVPRLADPSMPLTVVFAGPTGSGKSTIVNSLTGTEMSRAGVLRPTTTRPVVLASVDRVDEYGCIADVECDVVAGKAPVLDTMVLVDTPDIDSTSTDHRRLAETLIDNADLVVFVTSALRYSDAVPWQVLRRAVARGAPVIQVLNRVTSATSGAAIDFRSRLAAAGLDDDLVSISEHHLTSDAQHLPTLAIRSLRRRLVSLVANNRSSESETFQRVLTSTIETAESLASGIEEARSEVQSWEAELSIEVSRRVHDLDLSPVAGVCPPIADGSARPGRRLWRTARKVQGLSDAETEPLVSGVVDILHRDLREWCLSGFWDGPYSGTELTGLVPGLLPLGRHAVEGWVDYVRRIGEEVLPESPGLAERALIDSVLCSEASPETEMLFDPDTDVLLGRADRELRGRLEVIYTQLAEHVSNRVRIALGDPDPDHLNSTLGAMGATLAPTRG